MKMRLQSFRDLKSGSIRVEGEGFAVEIQTDGRVITAGAVQIEQAQPAVAAPQRRDTRSPRSRPSKKRGSR